MKGVVIMGKANEYTYKGRTLTLKGWSEVTGINANTLKTRITDKKWSVEKALETPLNVPKMYTYEGRTLSLLQWSEVVNIPKEVLERRIVRLKWSLSEALTTPCRGRDKKLLYKGKYLTIKELSDLSGIKEKTIRARLNILEWSVEDAVEKPLRYSTKKAVKYTYGDVNLSFSDLSEKSGLSDEVLRGRLVKLKWSLEKAVTTPVRKKRSSKSEMVKRGVKPKKYTFEGKSLTLKEWSKVTGISQSSLKSRMNDYNWSIEKTLTTPFNPSTTYTYGGKTLSLKDWGEELGIAEITLRKRLSDLGWSLEKTLSTPVRPRKSRK